jgi:hypothetical protein
MRASPFSAFKLPFVTVVSRAFVVGTVALNPVRPFAVTTLKSFDFKEQSKFGAGLLTSLKVFKRNEGCEGAAPPGRLGLNFLGAAGCAFSHAMA